MSIVDQIVQVSVTATSATPALPGTDIPAIIAYHTHNTDKIRTYFDVAGMVSDGFSLTEAAAIMAAQICAQSPRPSKFKVIRGTTSVARVFTFKVTDTNTGDVVGFKLTDDSGNVYTVQHTNTVGQTAVQIATALAGVSVTGATLANGGGTLDTVTITITSAGHQWWVSSITGGNWTDTTPSASPQTDLAAAALVDPNWYGIAGEWLDATNIAAIAAWAETNKKLHAYTTADAANLTAGTGVFSTLKASAYAYSYGQFSGTPIGYGALSLMAQRFTDDAGSDTWAFKTLAGVAVDNLTAAQIEAATPLDGAVANNGNVYVPAANVNVTLNGVMASGLFADIRRGIDALTTDMQLRVLTLMLRAKKIPYTRKGCSMVAAEIKASLQSFVNDGFISNDAGNEFAVTVPDISTVAATDKTNRILRNVKWTAVAQGAVQTVLIQGTLNF